jgi:hypothetical protein
VAGVRQRYWPALYFIDARGRRRHHHFGEEDYERSEQVIQQLLAEAGSADVDQDVVRRRGSRSAADSGSTSTSRAKDRSRGRHYQLVRHDGGIVDRTFGSTFLDPARYKPTVHFG